MPPCHAASFGALSHGTGFGSEIGLVDSVPGGRLLFRDTWNAELYGGLQAMYEAGKKAGTDVWIHKNRMSGLWGVSTLLQTYLEAEGIRTLFFTGVNTDQCVLGTLVDGHNKGYDTVRASLASCV